MQNNFKKKIRDLVAPTAKGSVMEVMDKGRRKWPNDEENVGFEGEI
jgi:hypothetical protein